MIARVNEAHVSRGYDPYNSADQPRVLAEMSVKRFNARIDGIARRGFKYLANHPQIAADILAWNLEFNRMMNAKGARRFDHDTHLYNPFFSPPQPGSGGGI